MLRSATLVLFSRSLNSVSVFPKLFIAVLAQFFKEQLNSLLKTLKFLARKKNIHIRAFLEGDFIL